VTSPFKPPTRDQLPTLDTADGVEYEAELRVVEGVVAPGGSGDMRDSDYDVHLFCFAAWRTPGSEPVIRELVLFRAVPPIFGQGGSSTIFNELPDYSIQRLSVLLSKDHRRAVVESLLAPPSEDVELRQLVERLREPVVVTTEQFGKLTMNPLTRLFEGTIKWNRRTIKLNLEADADGNVRPAIETAARLHADQASWTHKVDRFALQKLLTLKNTSWLGEAERQLTAAQFTKRKKLESISAAGDGSFQFWHDDGDMFLGHAILVSGTLEDGPTDAGIQG
jgi:hypothetical protein